MVTSYRRLERSDRSDPLTSAPRPGAADHRTLWPSPPGPPRQSHPRRCGDSTEPPARGGLDVGPAVEREVGRDDRASRDRARHEANPYLALVGRPSLDPA